MTSFPKWPPAKSANFIFSLISASKTHRDMILVSIPMFLMARNPLVPLLKLYDCWLTQKFKMAANIARFQTFFQSNKPYNIVVLDTL